LVDRWREGGGVVGFSLLPFCLQVKKKVGREACARGKRGAWSKGKEEGREDHAGQVVEAPCFSLSASA
jgi:hypothetical protein